MEHVSETPRDLWRRRIDATPDDPFLIDGSRTWTFGEADVQARRLARGLAELGVGTGHRVLVGMENRAEAVLVHQAVRELGAVLVPLLEGLTFAEAQYQINHSEATILVVDAQLAATILPQLAACPAITRVVRGTVAEDDVAPADAHEAVRLDDLLTREPLEIVALEDYGEFSPWAILYTSGSTGKPKGVVIPAGAFASAGDGYARRYGIRAADNYVLPLTLAHAVGALTAQAVVLQTGCRLTVLDRFSPSRWWQQVRDAGGTFSIMFPAQLNLLLQLDDPSATPGSHPFRLAITHVYDERFRQRFGVELAISWGLTETGATSLGTQAGYRGQGGDGYVGTPMAGVEVAVMDPEMRPLGPDRPGEICLRHRHVMLEYLKEPELTAATLDAAGWVRSGDLGQSDSEGGVHFHGRMKNVIKRAGENISAEEVEAALSEHPDVVECLVTGVPDRVRTEEVAAVVVRRPGTTDADALARFAAERIARWKVPRYIAMREVPLPRLGNGKVDRLGVTEALDLQQFWDRTRAS